MNQVKEKTQQFHFNYSLIIPTFNSEKTIEHCLNSVKKIYDENKIEIIVCDNLSSDRTLELVKKFPFKLIQNKKKQSASSTRNLGAINSSYENLIFLDSDCVAPKNLISIIENTPNFLDLKCIAGNFSKKNIYKNFLSQYKTSYTHFKWRYKKKNVLNSAIMFIKKKYFFKVEMFDENLKSMEDDDFSIRFQNKGYSIIYNNNLEVDHYKEFNFMSLTKNDFFRTKQLVKIFFNNITNNQVKNYKSWLGLYFRGIINCLVVALNIIFLCNYIFFDYNFMILEINNLMILAIINFIYLFNNLDVFLFNLRNYGFIFSLLTLFFQFFTFFIIFIALTSRFVEHIFRKFSQA